LFYDKIGKESFKTPFTRQINTSRLPKGLNFVKIIHENGDNEIVKLIIQ